MSLETTLTTDYNIKYNHNEDTNLFENLKMSKIKDDINIQSDKHDIENQYQNNKRNKNSENETQNINVDVRREDEDDKIANYDNKLVTSNVDFNGNVNECNNNKINNNENNEDNEYSDELSPNEQNNDNEYEDEQHEELNGNSQNTNEKYDFENNVQYNNFHKNKNNYNNNENKNERISSWHETHFDDELSQPQFSKLRSFLPNGKPNKGINEDFNVHVANLPRNFTKQDLRNLFAPFGEIVLDKIVNEPSQPVYGFVQFKSASSSHQAIKNLQHYQFPSGESLYVSLAIRRKFPSNDQTNLCVKNLPSGFDHDRFRRIFSQFGVIVQSRVADRIAFVRYETHEQASLAIKEMHNKSVDGAELEIRFSARKHTANGPRGQSEHQKLNEHNLYIRNLPKNFQQGDLELLFSSFGIISSAKINENGVAFVRYNQVQDARKAIKALHGTTPDQRFVEPIVVKFARFDIHEIKNRKNGTHLNETPSIHNFQYSNTNVSQSSPPTGSSTLSSFNSNSNNNMMYSHNLQGSSILTDPNMTIPNSQINNNLNNINPLCNQFASWNINYDNNNLNSLGQFFINSHNPYNLNNLSMNPNSNSMIPILTSSNSAHLTPILSQSTNHSNSGNADTIDNMNHTNGLTTDGNHNDNNNNVFANSSSANLMQQQLLQLQYQNFQQQQQGQNNTLNSQMQSLTDNNYLNNSRNSHSNGHITKMQSTSNESNQVIQQQHFQQNNGTIHQQPVISNNNYFFGLSNLNLLPFNVDQATNHYLTSLSNGQSSNFQFENPLPSLNLTQGLGINPLSLSFPINFNNDKNTYNNNTNNGNIGIPQTLATSSSSTNLTTDGTNPSHTFNNINNSNFSIGNSHLLMTNNKSTTDSNHYMSQQQILTQLPNLANMNLNVNNLNNQLNSINNFVMSQQQNNNTQPMFNFPTM